MKQNENNDGQLRFGDNITMSSVNPHNFALKNEYISNLISTCLIILPVVNSIIGKENTRVTRGFLSRQYMSDTLTIPDKALDDVLKHSRGLALSITFDMFEPDTAIAIAHAVGQVEEQVKVVIDIKREQINFYRENSFFEIYEKTNQGLRLIFINPKNM